LLERLAAPSGEERVDLLNRISRLMFAHAVYEDAATSGCAVAVRVRVKART